MTSDVPNYAALSPPEGKPPKEYSYVERRAEIYRLIEEAGHPHNLERSQRELADRYGCSQANISKDMKRLREFEAEHNSDRATSVTSWLAEKAVMSHLRAAKRLEGKAGEAADPEDETKKLEAAADRFEKAMRVQQEYNHFLFELGDLNSAPTEIEFGDSASDMYMQMLEESYAARDEHTHD